MVAFRVAESFHRLRNTQMQSTRGRGDRGGDWTRGVLEAANESHNASDHAAGLERRSRANAKTSHSNMSWRLEVLFTRSMQCPVNRMSGESKPLDVNLSQKTSRYISRLRTVSCIITEESLMQDTACLASGSCSVLCMER